MGGWGNKEQGGLEWMRHEVGKLVRNCKTHNRFHMHGRRREKGQVRGVEEALKNQSKDRRTGGDLQKVGCGELGTEPLGRNTGCE